MSEVKIGDIVTRKSYGRDVFFKVVDIRGEGDGNVVTLQGISYRIEADAPESDLELEPESRVREYRNKSLRIAEEKARELFASRYPRQVGFSKKAYYRNTAKENVRKFSRPGKILHIDGDEDYLEICIREYRKLGMEVTGKNVPEKDQPSVVYNLLEEHKPDILVLTGHDGLIKGDKNNLSITNYRNSRYFIEAVKQARKYEGDLDSLVIFAGACQSMYNEIIKAGANYASAPYRVLIHALDPVFICQKIAFAGIDKVVSPMEVVNATITGVEGIGGIQTRGKYRDGYPVEPT